MRETERLELVDLLEESSNRTDGYHATPLPGVHVIRGSQPGLGVPTVLNPSLCVIVQGSKRVAVEQDVYLYTPPQFLVVSVDLPVTGNVLEATKRKPYLCLQIDIDQSQLADLFTQTGMLPSSTPAASERGIFVGTLDATFTDSILRLARMLRTPRDIPALAPLAIREVHYRLLSHPCGGQIAQIAIQDSSMERIARVLARIKTRFNEEHRVEHLAEMANMSPSSFHAHFKSVTAMSPLQYVKKLRLLEARRLLVAGEADAARAALQVGYESPSQFSREYSRMFGAPPARDAMRLRQASA
ncbi:AraC family transcriptional regulator [Bryobacterales bacterium F-183]|nr:AraC family transcriptional regulator [Bryobacterales bacterium F-183]